jgi:predicted RNase H-like nuclease (RuvC/YqgF family)
MTIESYIEDILKSPELTFRKIVSKIIQKSDESAKIELVRQHIEVDEVLFAAIKSILNDLRLEEGIVSQFLYKYLNIEFVKNKKREQLIILGTELKRQYSRLKREQNRVDTYILNLTLSLDNLKRLKDAFDNKRNSLQIDREINKSDAFVKKLNSTIDELTKYRDALRQKFLKLSETKRLYINLYKQIPRYYELQEESVVSAIPASPKKQKRFSWS